tara:strand:- start:124 stop:1497 length:1374 start_codon:yes stop_codon:yes gene_type:complete
MQYILIIIGLALIAPYIVWFAGAKIVDWITSIVFLVFFSLVIMYGRYRTKEDEGTLLRHQSFDAAYNFTFATLGFVSVCGFFYLLAWFYGGEGAYDFDKKIQLKSFQLAGIFVFSIIGCFIMLFIQEDKALYEQINPFQLEKEKYLEKKKIEDSKKDIIKKLEGLRNRCNSWLEKNMDKLKSISKQSKSLERKIDTREKHLNELRYEYYDIPKCSKCNTDELYLIDINALATGIELMCEKCSKKIWVHAKQDKIKNAYKYVTYLKDYFSFYDNGYSLNDSFMKLLDEYQDIHRYKDELEGHEYFDEIIEYEQRFNINAKYAHERLELKRGKSYHPLDPDGYDSYNVFPEIYFRFEREEEEIEEGKREYISFYSDSFYSNDEENTSESIEDNRSRKPPPQHVKDKVWNRDGGKCVECGSNENLEFDHIIPHSKGGANTYRNIQLLCEPCNRTKSAKIG